MKLLGNARLGPGSTGPFEQLGDLGAGEPQKAQCGDRLDPPLIGAVVQTAGADDRSVSPAGPSAQVARATLRAVRSLIPAAPVSGLPAIDQLDQQLAALDDRYLHPCCEALPDEGPRRSPQAPRLQLLRSVVSP